MITGSFRRTGPDTFVIKGTAQYVEVDKQADRDHDEACARGFSCDTRETYGVVKFTGRGSTKKRTIEFTWKGRDRESDTRALTGKGKAKYRSP